MDPDRAHSRLASKHEKEDQTLYADQLSQLLSTPAGRRFISLFLSSTRLFDNAFAQDPAATAFNLGIQSVGQRLVSDISNVCPHLYLDLLKETTNVNRTRSAEHERIDYSADRTYDYDPGN